MTGWQRLRVVVNWVNLMTPLGLLVGKAGGSTVRKGPHGLYIGTGYRRRIPIAGAFTLGNVITTKHTEDYLLGVDRTDLLAHEMRHSVQSSILGPLFLPAYFAASSYSYLVGKDWGSRNVFEVWAGLADGNYERKPVRPGLARAAGLVTRRRATRTQRGRA
jgi:hypothetical protein